MDKSESIIMPPRHGPNRPTLWEFYPHVHSNLPYRSQPKVPRCIFHRDRPA